MVTGAAQGIGRGIALALAKEGANVVVNDRANRGAAAEVVKEAQSYGGDAIFWQADVSDRQAVAEMYRATVDRYGGIDIAVSNAALNIREPVVDAEWDNVLATIEVTQFGVFHVCQMAAQQMVKQEPNPESRGKIIIVSSVQAEVAAPDSVAYNMSKAAINHMARTMAAELAGDRVNVNVILPGWIDTPGERSFYTDEELQEGGRLLPWGRMGRPDDIARAAAFLASDDANYITGTELRVDGGYVVARSTVD